jgi:D-amino-acid dehydrogenase
VIGKSNNNSPVVVIGAGIVGVVSACCLQREGHSVVVMDPDPPGEGASFGNAGCLNGSSVVPVAMPGVLTQVPRWLLDPEGPLAIRWRYLPALAPWLVRFVRASQRDKVEAQARALRLLLSQSVDDYRSLVKEAGAEGLIHRLGHLFAYRSDATFQKDTAAMRLREANGIIIDELSADELRQLEPHLSRDYVRGRLVSENGHCSNPLRLVTSLVELLVRNGGEIRRERALDFVVENGKVTGVCTDAGVRPASQVVVAAGAFSKPLAAKLGDNVPLDTERGYHVMLRDPEVMPRIPTMSVDDKCVVTPMETGIRIAGVVEFAGLEAPPDWSRARVLLKQGRAMYPGLARDVPEERLSRWMGFRPSMPDSLPVIGPASGKRNVFYAFGHGHVGLAGAAMTGRIIAALASGKPPPIDTAPFSVTRW